MFTIANLAKSKKIKFAKSKNLNLTKYKLGFIIVNFFKTGFYTFKAKKPSSIYKKLLSK